MLPDKLNVLAHSLIVSSVLYALSSYVQVCLLCGKVDTLFRRLERFGYL